MDLENLYKKPKCLEQLPPLVEFESGHQVACHLVKGN